MNLCDTGGASTGIVRFDAPLNLRISTVLPVVTATSPRKAGIPEPSTTRPFLISRSYAIGILLMAVVSTASVASPEADTHPMGALSHDEDAGVVIVKGWRQGQRER